MRKGAVCLLLLVLCMSAARAAGVGGSLTVHMTWQGRAATGGSLTLYEVGQTWEGETSPQTVERAMEYVKAQDLQGETQPVGQQGIVFFDGLVQAVYLVVQHEPSPGYRPINPFLVCIREGENGQANPKLLPDDAPETGDPGAMTLWLILMAASLVCAGVTLICKIRTKKDSGEP